MEGLMRPFDMLPPMLGLCLLSLLTGIGVLWVVGKTTPQQTVKHARDRMDSAVYEIRLFLDSPKRVVLSLGRLIFNSVVYIASMLPAFIILAIPLGMMALSLESRYGLAPLQQNTPVVVQVELAPEALGRELRVEAGPGLSITSPLMFVEDTHEVFFRMEAHQPTNSTLTFQLGDEVVHKDVSLEPNVAPDRASGLARFTSLGQKQVFKGKFEAFTFLTPPKMELLGGFGGFFL